MGQQEDKKRICDEEWGYGLSIKYHERLPTQYKVNGPSGGNPLKVPITPNFFFLFLKGMHNLVKIKKKN